MTKKTAKTAKKTINASIKKKWVAALRSGKYEQGDSQLCSEDGKYCCLGVLAEIVDPGRKTWAGNDGYFASVGPNGDPFSGRGTHDAQVALLGAPLTRGDQLTEYNDSGKSFRQIAAIIERSKVL